MAVNLPEPFLGRMILEIIKESPDEYKKALYGLDAPTDDEVVSEFRSKFEIVEADVVVDEDGNTQTISKQNKSIVPFKKGVILVMAPDAFGERYKKNYGTDGGPPPEVGDTVLFVPNQTYKIDAAGQYHIIGDENIVALYRKVK